jgi:predicted DCC family thiol-disulfide oxidoreductase YuxK
MNALRVWYDGGCPLCLREIALMRRLDWRKRIEFVDATSDNTSCPLDKATLLQRFHAQENGTIVSGAAAFAAMWRAIPLLRPLGLLAQVPPILKLLEWLYIRFLIIRPRVQRFFA